MIALKILNDALPIVVFAYHADHGARCAKLPECRQCRGNFAPELPAGFQNLGAFILFCGKMIDMHEVVYGGVAVSNYFSHKKSP